MARPGRVTRGQVRGGAVGRGPRRRAPARAGRRPLLPGLGRHTLAVAATWAQLRGALTRGPGQPGQPLSRLPRRCWGASRPRGSRPCRGAVRPSVRPSVASCVSSPLFVGVASNGPMTWRRGRGPWRQHSRPWPPLRPWCHHTGGVFGGSRQPEAQVPPRSPESGSHPAAQGPGPTPQPGGPGPTLRAQVRVPPRSPGPESHPAAWVPGSHPAAWGPGSHPAGPALRAVC